MKRLLLLPIGLLMLASCKEKNGPFIDFTPKPTETEFMAAPETPQQRIVLIEEFTGVTCPNCPIGHQVLKSIEDANVGRVAVMSIQPIGATQAKPVTNFEAPGYATVHDNRTKAGTDLGSGIYGSTNTLPQAGFDRVAIGGVMLFDRTEWPGNTTSRLSVAPKANVTVTSTYNASTKQATIKVHVAYTSAVATGQVLTVALVEDEVIDAQLLPFGSATIAQQDYHHQNLLRDILTAPTGTAILGTMPTKAAGQVYERTFVYTVNSAWNPDHCRLVAFVSDNGTDKEVVQAAMSPLK